MPSLDLTSPSMFRGVMRVLAEAMNLHIYGEVVFVWLHSSVFKPVTYFGHFMLRRFRADIHIL